MPDNWWNAQICEKILLKHGVVVNVDSSGIKDVLIYNDKIKKISKTIENEDEDTLVLDAEGMFVIPGGIDPSTHLEYEFMGTKTIDDFYYGTKAALAGGTTTIIDYVVPHVGESLISAYKRIRTAANSEVVCDYGLHMTLNWWDEDVEREMGQVVIACGINSFMMYMNYKEMYMLTDSEIYQICLRCRKLGALPMIAAENGSIIHENEKRLRENGLRGIEGHYLSRPEILQVEAANRACIISGQVRSPLYVCNVMSVPVGDTLNMYHKLGYPIFGETIAAALGAVKPKKITIFRKASAFVTSPPISDNECYPSELMKQLAKGKLVTTASNHCTYTNDQKAKGRHNFIKIPHGVNGVEDRMSVIWEKGVNTGILSISQFVAVTSTNAAKLFNMYPRKGVISEGSDADIVVWNPNRFRKISRYNQRQACDNNIFHGMNIQGGPEYVFIRGNMCVDKDVLRVHRGYGRYMHTDCFAPMVYGNRSVRELRHDDFGENVL